jgi:hypothetical protein
MAFQQGWKGNLKAQKYGKGDYCGRLSVYMDVMFRRIVPFALNVTLVTLVQLVPNVTLVPLGHRCVLHYAE